MDWLASATGVAPGLVTAVLSAAIGAVVGGWMQGRSLRDQQRRNAQLRAIDDAAERVKVLSGVTMEERLVLELPFPSIRVLRALQDVVYSDVAVIPDDAAVLEITELAGEAAASATRKRFLQRWLLGRTDETEERLRRLQAADLRVSMSVRDRKRELLSVAATSRPAIASWTAGRSGTSMTHHPPNDDVGVLRLSGRHFSQQSTPLRR